MAVALMPSNFFHPVWLGGRPTQASSGPGRRLESRPGAPVCRVGPSRPTVDTKAARSRPLAAEAPGSEWGRGGRSAQARSPRPAGFARGPRHAPRAQSTWPRGRRVSLTLETQSPGGGGGPGHRRARQAFPDSRRPRGPRLPRRPSYARACVSAFGGQSPAGGRLHVRRAFPVPRPKSSRTGATRLFSATSGKSPWRKTPADARAGKADPPAQTRPPPGSEGRRERLRQARSQAPLRRGDSAPGASRAKPGALGSRRRQGDVRLSRRHERGAERGREGEQPARLQVSRSRRAETLPETGSGAGAELRQTPRTAAPRAARSPQPRARHPPAGRGRPRLLFARVAPRGAARTALQGSRGGRPSSRRAAPSLSVSSPPARGPARSSSAQHGSAGESPKPGRLLPERCPRKTPARAPPGARAGDLHTSAGAIDGAAGPPPPPPYQTSGQIHLRPAAGREKGRPGAEQRAPPAGSGRHFPQPARTRAPPPQHFRFQTRSSFKVISVRPAGRRPPSPAPLLLPPLGRTTNKFPEPRGNLAPAPLGLRAPLPPDPAGARPAPPRASGPPVALPAPSPAHKRVACLGAQAELPARRRSGRAAPPP